nr:hypothetical protein [Tanacetum cinerariifolium]
GDGTTAGGHDDGQADIHRSSALQSGAFPVTDRLGRAIGVNADHFTNGINRFWKNRR